MFSDCPSLNRDISIGQNTSHKKDLLRGACCAMSKTLDRYKGLELVKAETLGELENKPGYQEGSVHFVECQPSRKE